MIHAESLFSIPESGNDIDLVLRRNRPVRTRIAHEDGDLALRVIAKDSTSDIMGDAEEFSGPVFDLKKKIEEWRAHVKDYATGAGFRKAHRGRGPMDPRQFALQLSRFAFEQGGRHRSDPMLRLAKRLRWVARQKTGRAALALERLAESEVDFGRPRVERPQDQQTLPQAVPSQPRQGELPSRQDEPEIQSPYVAPGTMAHPPENISGEPNRLSHRRRADSEETAPEPNGDLIQHARKFLQRYMSINSLSDDPSLSEQISQPDVFESWIVDLDSKGVIADPEDLDQAWDRAVSDLSGDSESGEPLTASRGEEGPSKDPFFAPGGDWANTVLSGEENPQLDRYLSRDGHRHARHRVSVTEAADQLLDHVSGEMVPGEISAAHVRQFVENEYPGVSWKKVYAVIEKIADPGRRHEEERDTSASTRQTPVASRPGHPRRRVTGCCEDPLDRAIGSSANRSLRGQKEICGGCAGTGEGEIGTCTGCAGSGRGTVDPDRGGLEAKRRLVERAGSLLVVAVASPGVPGVARGEFHQLTGARVAGTGVTYHRHSTALMRLLRDYNIPYRTATYCHPHYQRSKRSSRREKSAARDNDAPRAWLIDPRGKIYNCDSNHMNCLKKFPAIARDEKVEYDPPLIARGWGRAGELAGMIYLEVASLNDTLLSAFRKAVSRIKIGFGYKVQIITRDRGVMMIPYPDFRLLGSAGEVLKYHREKRFEGKRRVSSLLQRAWILSPDGKIFPCGQDHSQCQEVYPELLQGRRTRELVKQGWGQVGYFDYAESIYLQVSELTEPLFRAYHGLVLTLEVGPKFRVEIITPRDTLVFSYNDFRKFDSLEDLTWFGKTRRSSVIAASPSDAMKQSYRDKRSWWIDPGGKAIDVGHDHNAFLEKRPKTFGKWADINKALTLNWVRVAFWGGEYVVHCHSITPAQIDACQKIYRSIPGVDRIYISTLNKSGYSDREDFLTSSSQGSLVRNLFNDPAGIRGNVQGNAIDPSRRAAGDEQRAWMVDPAGKIYSCGRDHHFCQEKDPSVFQGKEINEMVDAGWAKVGSFARLIYMETSTLTDLQIHALQDIALQLEMISADYVQLVIRGRTSHYPYKVFRKFNSVDDIQLYEKHRKKISRSVL